MRLKVILFFILWMLLPQYTLSFSKPEKGLAENMYHDLIHHINNEERPMLIKTFPDLDSVSVNRKYIEEYNAYVFDPSYYDLRDEVAANQYYNRHFVGKDIASILELFETEKENPAIKRYFNRFRVGYNQAKNPVISYALGLYISYEGYDMDVYAALTWHLVFVLDDDKKIVQRVAASTTVIGP